MKKSLAAIILIMSVFCSKDNFAQLKFSIEEVILKAKSQSPVFKVAETRKMNRYWQFRMYRTNYNPQVRLIGNSQGVLYSNSITPIRQPDGSIIYIPLNQVNPGLNMALQQPLQLTGGTISFNSSYNYFNDIANNVRQWNGSPAFFQLNQPLFAYNQLKWDRKIEPIKYEESKRDYAESMEAISRDAAGYFFDLLQAQINLDIAKYNLANNDTIYKIEQGRYGMGNTSEDKLLQVELQLLRSRQDVALADLNIRNLSYQLRSYIGLKNGEAFTLIPPDTIPQFDVNEEDALEYAKKTRSAFIAFERRRQEAKSAVAQARGQLYQVNLTASYGLNNVAPTFNDIYRNTSKQQFANLSFNVPILDWGRRRATMQTAYANKTLQDYIIAQDEITFEQEVLTQARQFALLRLSIEISKKADRVALERYIVAQNRYLVGKIDITNLNIALQEKDNARRQYIQTLKNFWTAHFDLRRLTLYDFVQKKFLYDPYSVD